MIGAFAREGLQLIHWEGVLFVAVVGVAEEGDDLITDVEHARGSVETRRARVFESLCRDK